MTELEELKMSCGADLDRLWFQVVPNTTVTICAMTMTNGFTVVGVSGTAHKEAFEPEMGKELALRDAMRQVGPFMAWRERDRVTAWLRD